LLVRISLEKASKDGKQHDLQVECNTPVPQIIEIILDAFADGGVTAPSIHLRPSRNSDLQNVSPIVTIYILQKSFDKMQTLWPGTDNAHVSLQYVKELGELIQIGPAQKRA
jgi:hypothetical protein